MKGTALATGAAAVLMSVAFAQHSHPATNDRQMMHSHHPTGEAEGVPGVITGYVRDIACLVRNPKAGAATTALTKDCLEKCVRQGSPIGILTEDGSIYLPISETIPDTSTRNQILPYTGKYVRASGKMLERGGLLAISMEKIEVIERPKDSTIPEL